MEKETRKKYRHWSGELVISIIQKKHKDGESLNYGSVFKIDQGLFASAKKYFGGWQGAITAAGLDYSKILLRGKNSAAKKKTPVKKPKFDRRSLIVPIGRGYLPVLSDEELSKLADKIQKKEDGWEEARNKIVEHNRPLALYAASYYARMFNDYDTVREDFIQEGEIALIRVAEKWIPQKGTFGNYATWWIKRDIRKAIKEKENMIWLPDSARKKWGNVRKFTRKFQEKYDREPTEEEIIDSFGLRTEKSRKRFKEFILAMRIVPNDQNFLRLDAPMENSDGDSESDFKEKLSDSELSPEQLFEAKEEFGSAVNKIEEMKNYLRDYRASERDIGIFSYRYGLDGSFEREPMRLVAKVFSVKEVAAAVAVNRLFLKLRSFGINRKSLDDEIVRIKRLKQLIIAVET